MSTSSIIPLPSATASFAPPSLHHIAPVLSSTQPEPLLAGTSTRPARPELVSWFWC